MATAGCGNPLLFPPPSSTRNWASRAVFGERVWAERNEVEIPRQFRSPVPDISNAMGAIGLVILAYGLVQLDLPTTIAGILVVNISKLWYLDRMVLLFEDVKQRDARVAAWEF